MKNITIIGNGNVANVFGDRLLEEGAVIREAVGRNIEEVSELAERWSAKAISDPSTLDGQSDIYLIAVNDDAIIEVAAALPHTSALVVHCSGSTRLDVISHPKRAVLWPLQSIMKGEAYDWSSMNIVLESDTDLATVEAMNMVDMLGATPVHMSKKERKQAHLVAVILNNFGNHLLHMADVLCKERGMDRRLFQELMSYTLDVKGDAAEHQTGPAVRGDNTIIERHVAQLKNHPHFQEVYKAVSDSIIQSQA